MKAAFIALTFISINHIKTAAACDLDDCALPLDQHMESARFTTVPSDDWAWMNHDLALARSFLDDGDAVKARQIVAGLDYALRIRAEPLVASRGRSRVMAFHRALQRVQLEADGTPLASLELRPARSLSTSASGPSGLAFGAGSSDEDGDPSSDEDDPASDARRDAEERSRADEPRRARAEPQIDRTERAGGPTPR